MKMKFFKNLKTIALIGGLTLSTSALADPIVVLSENTEDFTQTETGYVLHFELNATAIELDKVKNSIQALGDKVQMTTGLLSDNKYQITYTVDHQNQPEYVYKMFLASGFKGIIHNGESKDLSAIVDILKSHQE